MLRRVPDCRQIAIEKINRRYTEYYSGEWHGTYAWRGMRPRPKGTSLEDSTVREVGLREMERDKAADTTAGDCLVYVAGYHEKV